MNPSAEVKLLIGVSYLFGFLVALSGILLGLTFRNYDREKWPLLRKLDGKKPHLLVFCIACSIVATSTELRIN